MPPKKQKKLIDKIVKKDYNNELEEILENKQFGENAKSNLLSILYKIETAYKDVETVKKGTETKEEYLEELLSIIKNKCDTIKIIRMTDKDGEIPENSTYVIDKENKSIIAYPIDRKILYAIAKIGKNDNIINDKYYIINETLSDLINVGNNINMVEPLRDFNGYSWSTITSEIESIDHNLIYQDLRMLVGDSFLNKWIQNKEYIIDYYDLFNEKLERLYGREIKEKLIEILCKISILLEVKFDKDKKEKYLKMKEEIEEDLYRVRHKEEYLQAITTRKSELETIIKNYDKVMSSKKLLQQEYDARNEQLPIEKKIFSMKALSKMMKKEREEVVVQIEKYNKIMIPKNFIKHQRELEKKYETLKIVDIDEKNELEEVLKQEKIEFQKTLIEATKIRIKKASTKQVLEKYVYNFRYYLQLPFDRNNTVAEKKELDGMIQELMLELIDKANKLKYIEQVSEDAKTNFEILSNIFKTRIIKIEDSYLKLIKEKNNEKQEYFVQIFDENIFEDKIKISKPEKLLIKPNKKVSIF